MKLLELDLQRSRGLDAPLVLGELGPGFNVVVGPNGSGKSSLCRGIAALLWETDDFQGAVQGQWEVDGATRAAQRESGAPPRWTGEGPPALPDAAYRGCFSFSVDDFLRETATEKEMHQVIRTELSAGFDLLRVLARQRAARPGSTVVNKRRQELEGAGRAVASLREEHRGLWQKEQGLNELLANLQGASRALADQNLHELALQLATKREELRQAGASLEAFPPGMDRLRGDELEKLDELRAACARLEAELGAEQEGGAAARAELEATGLQAPVPESDLELLAELGRELREREQAVEGARAAEARAAAGIEESRRVLRAHGAPTAGAAAGADWPRLEQLLGEWQKLEARREELEAIGAAVQPEGAAGEAAAPYEQAMALLASWLESAGGVAAIRVRSAAWGVVALGVVAVLAAALRVANEPLSLALGLVLLGLGAWLVRAPRGAERGAREREFAQLPVGPPSVWEARAVARRLSELQAESAACRARELDRLRAQEAAAKLERLAPRHAELARELHEMALACGVSPESAQLGIVAVAAERERLARAERELAEAQAAKNEARSRLSRALARTGELLAAHGIAPVADAAGIDAARGELARREHARRTAEKDAREAEARGRRLQEDLERGRRSLARLAEERGLGELPEAELGRRLDQLVAWREASERFRALEADVRSRAQQLEEHPELAALELAEAERRREENERLAEKQGELQGEVAALEHAIGEARRGHGLEEALAEEAEARERLAESRDELFEAAAAEFLVEDVARDHRSLAQPDLLREVGRLFARFTRQRYELRPAALSSGGGLPFEIHETDGEERTFAELSSGTRAQLGLALRIAVARSVEVGEALPLVLDEALTNSDPERFRDVVRSLAELVGEGRQVFFFTADDADAQRLEEVLAEEGLERPRRFDLAALRGETRRAERVRTERLPEVPAPESGETAADYAERLGVPRLDPFAGVEALHPFYLAGDDLAGLHELLRERVDSVGRARALLADAPRLWSAERRARFEALRQVAATWLDHFRIGRAPELQPEVLREGPAGRTKFVDALVEVNEELARDAAALIEALELPAKLRDPRLKGFRKAILYELTGDLAERGLYSLDEPRRAEERVERCLEASRDAVAREVLNREEVRQLANAFEQWCAG